MSHHHTIVVQFAKMLKNLDRCLDKAVEHAQKKSFEPAVLLQARLSPDQWPLIRQIGAAADGAKFAAARLAGKEPPRHPDTEQTVDEIRTRLRSVVEYVESFKPSDFEGADARAIPLPFMGNKVMDGRAYLQELVLPNFYFHVATAYAILRHNGVELGKMDYLGSLDVRDT